MSLKKCQSTLSNYEDVQSNHLIFDLNVDFESKTISGSVTHELLALNNVDKVVLDTNLLNISQIQIDENNVGFSIGEKTQNFGSALVISISMSKGETKMLKILYSTSPESSAIQWLAPEQTADKQYPYVFTQCQSIHARSLLPCFDTPSIKTTYEAIIKGPKWATILMSALQEDIQNDNNEYATFKWLQPVPISSYLIAIAVGQLKSKDLSHRCRVWSEPSQIDKVSWEFQQTEEFLCIAESLTCAYKWNRYDLLCLPPSFPYGGMENPCLTFVTPTLIAGDRSLVSVVAHEIAHSWTGNLITNHTWEHFWLNEGYTMWLERKIQAKICQDPRMYDFDAILGWKHLEQDVKLYGNDHQFTANVPDLEGIDPDDAFSAVPYEKGFNLLYQLEKIVGTQQFEEFTKKYIEAFQFKTITSDQFKDFFMKHFEDQQVLSQFDWESNFYKPGMPEYPNFDTTLAQNITNLVELWKTDDQLKLTQLQSIKNEFQHTEFKKFTTSQKSLFLDLILDDTQLTQNFIYNLDHVYNFNESKNCEICVKWYTLCLKAGVETIVPSVFKFLLAQGRMKYVRPLYRELFKSSFAKQTSISLFQQNKNIYHPIAQKMISQDLQL